MVAAVPSGSMDGITAWLAGEGIQRIFVGTQKHLIYYVPLAVLAITLLKGVFSFIESYTIRLVGASAIRDLRNELFCHLEKQPLLYFQSQSSGVLIGRMTNDIGLIENAISQTFQSMISRTITIISLAIVLIYQSFWLSIIAVGILSLIVVPVSIFGKRSERALGAGRKRLAILFQYCLNRFRAQKLFNRIIWNSFRSVDFWLRIRAFNQTR